MTAPAARLAVNPWLVAAVVVVPTFMEVLDTTIANVALRYIAGGLSAAETDAEWVITSYLAANAVVLPMSGWLSAHLGRRNYFLLSVGIFTLASGLCGTSTSLLELIFFRVIQGLAGGGLQPSTQAVLLDTFPPEKQGTAMTLFGVAALIAPIIGPTLGGWLTDNYSWRWTFLINVPVGAIALWAAYTVVEDPPYLKEEKAKLGKQPLRFDFIGLGLLSVTMAAWETCLSKGQEWDWIGDAYWRFQPIAGVGVACFLTLLWWELRQPNPLINFRPLADRNFLVASVIIFCAYGVLYGQTTSLPGMLQSLLGYDATQSGLVLSPSGFFSVSLLPVVGVLMARGLDARWLIAAGLAIMAGGNYWLANLNLEVDWWNIVYPRVVTIIGLSLIFAPLNVAAYRGIPREMRGTAVGLFSLLRNEGGSVGTSIAQTISERRDQFHTLRLGEFLDPLNQNMISYRDRVRDYFETLFGDPVGSEQKAYQVIDNVRQQQAQSLSYFDVFFVFAVIAAVLVPMAFVMRPSKAEKGAPVGGE